MGSVRQRSAAAPQEEGEVPSLIPIQPVDGAGVFEVAEVAEAAGIDPLAGESATPADLPAPWGPDEPGVARETLGRALAMARTVYGSDREDATDGLNALLDATRVLQPAEAGRILGDLLDSRTLDGLEGSDGWTARARAAGALISLPWPHALQIMPEDLEHLREVERRPHRTRDHAAVAPVGPIPLVVLGIGAAADVFFSSTDPSAAWLLGLLAALTAGVTMSGLLPQNREVAGFARLAPWALFAVGMAGAVAPLFTGSVEGFFLGSGAFVAGWVAWMKR